jgi:DNA sulfur modification protein DndB
MKIPAIRAKMGTWTYYVSTLTFQQVNDYVSRVDEELHKSESLKQLIQRSVTNNYKSIKEYIEKQPELFFNSLVLAVYDDYPDWREIEVKYEDFETHRIGVLEFPGSHKIFPLDGQHRVEGIKAALKANPELGDQIISAIFVGHKNDEAGMRKSRRLFSTLNRYAKPVTMDDIIALDEDDSVAIVTRSLLEEFGLFTGRRVTKSKNKAIPDNDKSSITSIITLYQCNRELLKVFRWKRKRNSPDKERDRKSLKEYLKFRPESLEVELFQSFCFEFWSSFEKNIAAVKDYTESNETNLSHRYRNKQNGGHLLFRPVGILPFVQACLEIHKRKQHSFDKIFQRMDNMDFTLNSVPWNFVIWNPVEKTMIMGASTVVKLLFLFAYGKEVIRSSEKKNLKEKYAAKLNRAEDLEVILDEVPRID